MAVFDYDNIDGLEGQDNLSGVMQTVLIAPRSWFATVAKPDPLVGGGYDVVITGDHTFTVGKGFIKLYTTYDTGKLIAKFSDQPDKTGGAIEFEGFIPGIKKETLQFLRNAPNNSWIVLVQDTNADPVTGERPYYQIGEEHLQGFVSGEFATNNLTGDRKGTTVKVQGFAAGLVLYEGVRTLKP